MLGSRNLPCATAVLTREVTTYDLLKHKNVLLSQEAAAKLSEGLAR